MTRFGQAAFERAVHDLSDLPPPVQPEIAFAGRSNAGKSSAINAICDHNKLARASKTPGRTQQINFFALADDRRLVDLPGYGFAKGPRRDQAAWEDLVDSFLDRPGRRLRWPVGIGCAVSLRMR